MFSPFSLRQAKRAFTLIELLTVMGIIAILIGLLLPVVGSVMNSSRKAQAAADETRIMTAVSAFQTDYGRLPINSVQQSAAANSNKDTVYGDPGGKYPSVYLFDILRAIPDSLPTDDGKGNNATNQLNPRQVVYFQAPNQKT